MENLNTIQDLKKISQHLNVLYIEDDTLIRKNTAKFLSSLFKRVDVSINGIDGLELYKEYYNETDKYYDIVITDIGMPELDGISMSKLIFEINRDQKIIIISGHIESDYLLNIIDIGIEGFIQKPFDIDKIINVLYKVCITFHFDDLQYFNAIVEASIMSKSDTNGIITYVNDNFCEISGYKREELIGQNHNIFRHPNNDDAVYKDMWSTISSGSIWKHRMINLNKDGSNFISDSTIIPLKDSNGNIKEYMAIRDDVTEIVKLEKEVLDKEQEHIREEKIKEAQKSFLVIFTHELKTPLNAIINFSKYIKKQLEQPKDINREKLVSLLESILNNSSDMLDNVTNILEISKLRAGKLSYKHSVFNLSELLKHLYEKFDSIIKKENIKITFNIDEDSYIHSDEHRVTQVISNVLSNAIKYGNDEISVILSKNKSITELVIEDNGVGIKDKEGIFNLYAQEDEELLNRQGKGTGIGLYFLKLICNDLDIKYKVEDRKNNNGTKFTLTFKNKVF